jgi:hypothetical protein
MKSRHLVVVVIVLFSLLAGSSFAAAASAQPLWIKQFGTAQGDTAYRVVTDLAGNVYVAGTTYGEFPGGVARGGADAFVAKYDSNGNQLWAVQIGSAGEDIAQGLAVYTIPYTTIARDVYVSGWTTGSLPGNTSKGGTDAFVARIDSATGRLLWVKQFGTPYDDHGYAAAVDKNGSVYVVGSTLGDLSGGTDIDGYSDAFIATIDPSGYRILYNQFSVSTNPVHNAAYDIAVDGHLPADYLYVTGIVRGYESGSLFVAKFGTSLNKTGAYHVLGSRDNDAGQAIAVDKDGNIIVAGYTLGAFDGNLSTGDRDIIVAKYDMDWNKLWSRQFGTAGRDEAFGLAVDAEGSIYVAGATGYPDGPGLDGQPYLGASDMFLTRLAPDGRKIYTRQLGTSGQDWAYGIALDSMGAIYLAGATEGLMGSGNPGGLDAVLIKYDKDGPVPPPVTDFFIDGTVKELPASSALESVSITVKDEAGNIVGEYLTDSSGRFESKITKAGKYFVHKLKIGYTAQVDPDDVTVSEEIPTATLVSIMEKIVVRTEMSFKKGYNTVRFTKLPASDRSVSAVFGKYAGSPYVGLIFSFDRPMQYLFFHGHKPVGNLKSLDFAHSYTIYTGKTFSIDTTGWVGPEPLPATVLPHTKHHGKIRR